MTSDRIIKDDTSDLDSIKMIFNRLYKWKFIVPPNIQLQNLNI